ncbi:MAG: ABC transporter permease [Lachnospiraceae bacterium]|nr:ABC transporter permease [Lachnospiraceae bacterium]
MNFIKRAVLYCLRQRVRALILFLVLAVTATFVLTGIAIRDASEGTAANVQTAIGGKIILETDTEKGWSSGQANEWGGMTYTYEGDVITEDIVRAISQVEGVVDYNPDDAGSYYGAGVDFQYLPTAFQISFPPYGLSSSYTATLSSEKCAAFQSGKYNLVAGRHITADDKFVCLISKELADYNNLTVGQKIRMYSLDTDSINEFEIVGLFDGTEGTSGNAITVDQIPANCGYIDYASMFEMFPEDVVNGYYQLTIYVEDPVSIQNVYDRINALPELKGKTLKLVIDTEEYDVVSAPLTALQELVNNSIIIMCLTSVVTLTLLLTIWIRSRKKEIGILLSIGKGKANVIAGFFTETLFAAIPAFAAAVPLSNLIARAASAFLISRVIPGTADLKVVVSVQYLLPLYAVGIALIVVSVLASSWTVVRLRPKDILSKMS